MLSLKRCLPCCLIAACVVLAVPPTHAQVRPDSTFEYIRPKPHDFAWEPGFDRSFNCTELPMAGPNPYEIGLPAALEAASRRELTIGGWGIAITWAEREADPVYSPMLKRLVEEYICWSSEAYLAFLALEAAGEPSEYFVRYAQDWRRSDRVAYFAMAALGVRGDSTANAALRAVAREAPSLGKFGANLQNAYGTYLGGLQTWDRFERRPIDHQLIYAARNATLDAAGGDIIRGVTGDSLSLHENKGNLPSSWIPIRALRLLGESHPTATAAAVAVYQDSARAFLLSRGVQPRHLPLFERQLERYPVESAFPPSDQTPAPPTISRAALGPEARVTLEPHVCIADLGGVPQGTPGEPFAEGTLAAVFSYASKEKEPVRVAYGSDNTLGVPRLSVGPIRPLPPEVFFPDGSRAYDGQLRDRDFRVAFMPGETVSWTLLGQTVTATADTPRCDEK